MRRVRFKKGIATYDANRKPNPWRSTNKHLQKELNKPHDFLDLEEMKDVTLAINSMGGGMLMNPSKQVIRKRREEEENAKQTELV